MWAYDTLRLKKNFQPKIEEHEIYFHARGIAESEKTCFEAFWRWKFFGVTEGTGVPKMWPLPIWSDNY